MVGIWFAVGLWLVLMATGKVRPDLFEGGRIGASAGGWGRPRVAIGTGHNPPYYPRDFNLTGTGFSPAILEQRVER